VSYEHLTIYCWGLDHRRCQLLIACLYSLISYETRKSYIKFVTRSCKQSGARQGYSLVLIWPFCTQNGQIFSVDYNFNYFTIKNGQSHVTLYICSSIFEIRSVQSPMFVVWCAINCTKLIIGIIWQLGLNCHAIIRKFWKRYSAVNLNKSLKQITLFRSDTEVKTLW
jgi:hypothetical protein